MKGITFRLLIVIILLAAASVISLYAAQAAILPGVQKQSAPILEDVDFVLPDEISNEELQQQELWQSSGKITFLRVHDVGTGYGPPSDFIDGEVVIKLNTEPNRAFGFQLRNDGNRPVRQGMLDLMRDAFNNNWTVTVDYWTKQGSNTGIIIRVWLTK